jgi:hypothetical protein
MVVRERRQFLVTAAIAVGLWAMVFLSSGAVGATSSPLAQDVVAVVRVYSAGEEVARYAAISAGYSDGSCFVFDVREGVRRLQRRVCMEHVVEWVR